MYNNELAEGQGMQQWDHSKPDVIHCQELKVTFANQSGPGVHIDIVKVSKFKRSCQATMLVTKR